MISNENYVSGVVHLEMNREGGGAGGEWGRAINRRSRAATFSWRDACRTASRQGERTLACHRICHFTVIVQVESARFVVTPVRKNRDRWRKRHNEPASLFVLPSSTPPPLAPSQGPVADLTDLTQSPVVLRSSPAQTPRASDSGHCRRCPEACLSRPEGPRPRVRPRTNLRR